MPAGYSETPLAKKLTLKDGMHVSFDGMPDTVRAEIAELGLALSEQSSPDDAIDAAHIFVNSVASLTGKLGSLTQLIEKNCQIWVSWPKKASGVATEVDEHDVRKAGLALGLVDTKKCAVDETWSGLKFVIRKENR